LESKIDMAEQDWLTLTEASHLLGVHPTTLRRWADKGDIPVRITPGGHRRFLRSELRDFLQQHQHIVVKHAGKIWEDYALVAARQRLDGQPEPRWVAAFSQSDRADKRELGRRLMSLLMQHISAPDHDQSLLLEARHIASQYAANCMQAGLTAAEGLEATMFFRDTMTEVALQMPQDTHLDPDAQLRLLRKLNQLFNVVQVSFVAYYDQTR
jgi:excisionase family DNA binding protein